MSQRLFGSAETDEKCRLEDVPVLRNIFDFRICPSVVTPNELVTTNPDQAAGFLIEERARSLTGQIGNAFRAFDFFRFDWMPQCHDVAPFAPMIRPIDSACRGLHARQNDGGVIAAITIAGESLRFPARWGRAASMVMQSPACNTYSSPSTQKCISPWITTICSSPGWMNGASGPSTPGRNSTQMNSIWCRKSGVSSS